MAKKMKKKGFKRFFLGLTIYCVVFLGLAYWGLTEFWSFIDAYELSRPKNAIAPYVEQLTKEQIAQAYDVPAEKIDIIVYGVVNSIKITFPRKNISGSLEDTDIYGCQQHVPLANIEL